MPVIVAKERKLANGRDDGRCDSHRGGPRSDDPRVLGIEAVGMVDRPLGTYPQSVISWPSESQPH